MSGDLRKLRIDLKGAQEDSISGVQCFLFWIFLTFFFEWQNSGLHFAPCLKILLHNSTV